MSDIAEETKNTVTTEEDTKHSGSGTGDEQTYASVAAGEEQSKKTGEDQGGARKNGESSGEPAKKVTKIPVTGGDDSKVEDSKKSRSQKDHSIPVTIHHDEAVNIPVTVHMEEKQKKPRQPTKKERAESIKQTANKEFAAKHYAAAIQLYNEALGLDPTNHLLYSNRAAARYNLAQEIASQVEHPDAKDHCAIHGEASPSWNAAMSLYYGGLEDALKAIEIEPNFLKAYLRVGACLLALGKYQAAVQTYEATLTRFPNEESVKTALKEAKEKAAKLEEGFPLYHSFINLAGQPRASEPPVAQSSPTKAASAQAANAQAASTQAAAAQAVAQESAARLHRELFGKRNALVQTPKPETRWQFYFEQPPNPRSAASWEPDTRRNRGEEDEDDNYYYQDEEEDEQQYRRPHAHFQRQPQYQQSQFKSQPPRFQRPTYQQQSQFHQHQSHHQQQPQYHSHQPSYQPPSQQSFQQSYQQPSYQPSYQQPFPQHTHYQQQPPSQSHAQPNRKRSDHTSIPNRKATNGYLQELCENLRVSQYLPALIDQGVETVDDLMLLSPEAIQSIFPTLGHQARVLDWLKKAKGEL